MKIGTLVLAVGLTLAAAPAFAQSQPNFGPNAPSQGDSFGKPPSGRLHPMSGARAYAYQAHSYHALRWHRHHYYRHHHY